MKYPRKRREESYWDLPPLDVVYDDFGHPLDKDGTRVRKKTRSITLYEWVAPDGTIYRSPHPEVLDKKRKRIE